MFLCNILQDLNKVLSCSPEQLDFLGGEVTFEAPSRQVILQQNHLLR